MGEVDQIVRRTSFWPFLWVCKSCCQLHEISCEIDFISLLDLSWIHVALPSAKHIEKVAKRFTKKDMEKSDKALKKECLSRALASQLPSPGVQTSITCSPNFYHLASQLLSPRIRAFITWSPNFNHMAPKLLLPCVLTSITWPPHWRRPNFYHLASELLSPDIQTSITCLMESMINSIPYLDKRAPPQSMCRRSDNVSWAIQSTDIHNHNDIVRRHHTAEYWTTGSHRRGF